MIITQPCHVYTLYDRLLVMAIKYEWSDKTFDKMLVRLYTIYKSH